ncbi:MAG: BMP family ABC transporter substrate-binding protein [Betaproteobacteria bacterium]
MRHLAQALALAAVAVFATACGKKEEPKPAPAPAPAAAPAAKPEPLKVGFVYVSPIGDAGWTTQHDLGRKALEAKLGDKVKTSYVENVPEGADAERVIRDLAQQGNKLIFTTSFGYMNPTLKVAEEFPDVKFEHATGYKNAKNVNNYNARFYEGRYLAGMLAGKMTKSNALGYVAAFPIPEVLQGINAFTLGARAVNPKAQVRVVWVNSWYDPGKERDAANTLMGQGADVLTHHTDSTAVVAAAEEKGKMAVAYHSNMAKFGPKAQIAAVTHHWGDYYSERAQKAIDGTWELKPIWGGIKEGMIKLEAVAESVPKEVVDAMRKTEEEIRAGTFHPFTGPIKSNEGKEVLPKDAKATDEQLNAMNYYVDGVVGKVPSGK